MEVDYAALGHRRVAFRPGTADAGTIQDVLKGYHRPPPDLNPKTILDLGAHAGYAALDLIDQAYRPCVFSVEPALDNWILMQQNLYGENRSLQLRAAASDYIGFGNMVGDANNAYKLSTGANVPVYTVSALLNYFGLSKVDYIKMDIEGEEAKVLRDSSWMTRTKCVKVELHDGISHLEAVQLLYLGGFTDVYKDDLHPYCVVAER